MRVQLRSGARMRRGQPLVVLGFQPPRERAAQAGRALPKRDRSGTVGVAELLFDERDALCRRSARPRSPDNPAAARSASPARRSPRCLRCSRRRRIRESELPELRVDRRQQRLVVLSAQPDDVVEGVEAGLPGHELRPQVLEVEVVRAARSGSREMPSTPSGSRFPARRAGCAGG